MNIKDAWYNFSSVVVEVFSRRFNFNGADSIRVVKIPEKPKIALGVLFDDKYPDVKYKELKALREILEVVGVELKYLEDSLAGKDYLVLYFDCDLNTCNFGFIEPNDKNAECLKSIKEDLDFIFDDDKFICV